MIVPLFDDNSGRRLFPYVTMALLVANIFVFFVLQDSGRNSEFTLAYSEVPAEILTGKDIVTEPSYRLMDTPKGKVQIKVPGLEKTPVHPWMTLITSMFMHGSLMHLIGNMWFLWIFGDNIEDVMGRLKYIVFYLTTGVAASLVHAFSNSTGESALIPCLGASGAISGVLGAYLIQQSDRMVYVLFLRWGFWVPGFVAVGTWSLFQVVSCFLSPNGGGGVAYLAHIGGLVAGIVLAIPMSRRGESVDRESV